MNTAELILMAHEWRNGGPEHGIPSPPDLLGFEGPIGFICSHCAGRIVGRGCSLFSIATVPVWQPAISIRCALCLLDEKDAERRAYQREEAEWEMFDWLWWPKDVWRFGGFSWPFQVSGIDTLKITVT